MEAVAVRISMSVFTGDHHFLLPDRVTQKQRDTLFDWCTQHNKPYPQDLSE